MIFSLLLDFDFKIYQLLQPQQYKEKLHFIWHFLQLYNFEFFRSILTPYKISYYKSFMKKFALFPKTAVPLFIFKTKSDFVYKKIYRGFLLNITLCFVLLQPILGISTRRNAKMGRTCRPTSSCLSKTQSWSARSWRTTRGFCEWPLHIS